MTFCGQEKRERERTLEAPSVGGLADETTDAAETIIHVLRPQLKHLGPEDETTGLAGVCARVGVQVSREAGTAASQHKIPAEIFFFPCATTRKKTFEFGQKKKRISFLKPKMLQLLLTVMVAFQKARSSCTKRTNLADKSAPQLAGTHRAHLGRFDSSYRLQLFG